MNPSVPAGLREVAASSWDAVVVGGGPAGAMTARELARGGASVLLVERAAFPRWKVCGSCLGPGTQEILRDAGLGDVLPGLGARALHTLRLAGWGSRADVPLGPTVAVSRASLDQALVEAAVGVGVTLLAPARARVGRCASGARRVTVEAGGAVAEIAAGVVVTADGLAGRGLAQGREADAGGGAADPAADPVGFGPRVASAAPLGFGALFPADTPGFADGVIHMAVGPEGYVGAVRLEDGTLDVAAALHGGRRRGGMDGGGGAVAGAGSEIRPAEAVSRLLEGAGFPGLHGAPLVGWRGTPRLTRTVVPRGGERLFAVGDAAGYVEPFTGEGIGWALAGARTLAPIALAAIRAWDPALVSAWDRAYGSTVGTQARLCRGLAWALRRPVLSRAGLGLLSHAPGAARPFVRWAGRTATPRRGRGP